MKLTGQSVIDKPDLFQPTPHIHDIGDVYGLEFQIDTLIAIREAIVVGDNEVHVQILARIDEAVDEFNSITLHILQMSVTRTKPQYIKWVPTLKKRSMISLCKCYKSLLT